jgi:hypothetical protein
MFPNFGDGKVRSGFVRFFTPAHHLTMFDTRTLRPLVAAVTFSAPSSIVRAIKVVRWVKQKGRSPEPGMERIGQSPKPFVASKL